MVYENVAFRHPVNDSVVTEDNLLDVGCVGDGDKHNVTLRTHLTCGVDHMGTQVVCLGSSSIPDREAVTRSFEVRRHAVAHCSQTYETESCHAAAP